MLCYVLGNIYIYLPIGIDSIYTPLVISVATDNDPFSSMLNPLVKSSFSQWI